MREPTPFTVTIDREDYEALTRIAEARAVTLAAVVRETLQRRARRGR
jgi:predicted DNA-binding ribbon-helix-helix protein